MQRYKTVLVPGGTRLYKSKLGHYNFVYPCLDKTTNLISDEEAEVLNWIKFSGKTPIRISSLNISGGSMDSEYTVLWKD